MFAPLQQFTRHHHAAPSPPPSSPLGSPQPPPRLETAFQIHLRARAAVLEVGEVPRFVEQIKLRGLHATFDGEFGNREAAAVDREAVAHLEPAAGFAERQREADGFALYARHCPVPAISDHSSLPCQCEKNVIERLLDVDIIAEETGYDSSRPCKFKVAVAT